MPKELVLTQGKVAIVDDGDFLEVSRWKWTFTQSAHCGYAARWETRDGRRVKIYLHRFLMDAGRGEQVDHINNDSLDDQRANLRVGTAAQNYANRRRTPALSSQFRGVYKDSRGGRWRARVSLESRTEWLGSYDTEIAAAIAYDAAALEIYGEFARLNLPGQQVA